ncbi:serine/threonine protein kinase [Cystobacter fuscus]
MSTNHGEGTVSPDELEPGTQVGRWRVVERLGVGGQGAVYRVEDLDHPGDFYALKLALHAYTGRAEREVALMMTRAAHPHVVGFHGCAYGPHPREGFLGFVMDWVPGRPWTSGRRRATPPSGSSPPQGPRWRVPWASYMPGESCTATSSPSTSSCASRMANPCCSTSAWAGTRARPHSPRAPSPATLYLLSPEAVHFLWHSPERPGSHYTFQPTDDLYALGVCLYRATTGHYPFSEWLPADVLQSAIVHVRPLAPVLVNPRVPRALSDVIVRLLAKNPSERYPSGAALHAALVAALSSKEPAWDASIFEWEEVPPVQEGGAPERHILRPPRPRPVLTSRTPAPSRMARRSHWPRRLALAASVLLSPVPVTRVPPEEPSLHDPDEEWATDVRVDPAPAQYEQAPLPVRNQKLAPCTEELEVELSGACWYSLVKRRPPSCPPQTVPYKGECLRPVPKSRPVPTSVDGGGPEAR